MEFDKSKVYTVLNADEVKIGSKGYFADRLLSLKQIVETREFDCFGTVDFIYTDDREYCFQNDRIGCCCYFYPVDKEEPEITEVTAVEWDNRPHFMKVWNNCYEDSYNMLVVHIRSADHSHPVVAVDCENEDICCFKHCAEIVLKKVEPEE